MLGSTGVSLTTVNNAITTALSNLPTAFVNGGLPMTLTTLYASYPPPLD